MRVCPHPGYYYCSHEIKPECPIKQVILLSGLSIQYLLLTLLMGMGLVTNGLLKTTKFNPFI